MKRALNTIPCNVQSEGLEEGHPSPVQANMLLEVFVFPGERMGNKTHWVKDAGDSGENFSSCVDFLRRIDRVEELVIVDVPIHTERSFVYRL